MEPESSSFPISIRGLAARLGVSHVTVSMALRDNPRVSAAQRERIKRAAEELGYRPDPMHYALTSYRDPESTPRNQPTVVWINAWHRPEELRGYKEFALYWKGARQSAAKFGFRLEEVRLEHSMAPARLHELLQKKGTRGILLPPHGSVEPAWEDYPWERFPWDEYPVVRFGRSLRFPEFHMVGPDQFTNTFNAVHRMYERGYKRIGLITFASDIRPRGPRFVAGFLAAGALLESASLPMFAISEPIQPDLVEKFRLWMDAEKPEALFSTVEQKILLKDAGYHVPQDIALAVSSVHDGGADSGIDQQPEEIGRVGFLLLNSLINDGARGIPKIFRENLVEGAWVDGTSLPDRRGLA